MTIQDLKTKRLEDLGYTGTFMEMERSWLINQGVTPSTFNDMWFEYLRSAGFTGSFMDMMKQWLIGKGYSDATINGLTKQALDDSVYYSSGGGGTTANEWVGYKSVIDGRLYVWKHGRGVGTDSPISISDLADAALGPRTQFDWFDVSDNGQWIIMAADNSVYVGDMTNFPTSITFTGDLSMNNTAYYTNGINRISDDGLVLYVAHPTLTSLYSARRANTTTNAFNWETPPKMTGTMMSAPCWLSYDGQTLVVEDSNGGGVKGSATTAGQEVTLFNNSDLGPDYSFGGNISLTSAGMAVIDVVSATQPDGVVVFTSHLPNLAGTIVSTTMPDTSPLVWDDPVNGDIIVSLSSGRPGNAEGVNELKIMNLDGSNEIFPSVLNNIELETGMFTLFKTATG